MIQFHEDGNKLTCIPEEEIIASNVPTMRETLIAQLDSNTSWTNLTFDCSRVETLDSIGINLIVGLYKKAKVVGKEFKVVGCNESILKVLKLFRLDEQFTVEPR